MVATPETRVTQAESLVAGYSANSVRVTQFDALVAINYPSISARTSQAAALVAARNGESINTSQALAMVAGRNGESINTSQAVMLVAARGRVQNPKLRAWTFTLDGHDYYVLRLGLDLTLVYDVYSEQWMDWDAFSETFWPVNIGINWVGGVGLLDPDGKTWGSNVLVGDDSLGLLYFLDPNQPYDDSFEGVLDPVQERYFPRVVMGQVAMKGRENLPCYAAWLTTDMGAPAYPGAGVTLEISDDAGVTFDDMGAVEITTGENAPELAWYSLGQIEAPGRLFRITDDGAVARIDGMEMNDPDDK